jgi:amino acid transporter
MSNPVGPMRSTAKEPHPHPDVPSTRDGRVLQADVLSMRQATIMGLGYLSLALSTYFILPLALASDGPNISYVIVATAIALAPTAVSFAVLSRRIPSAGSAYDWLWRATHPIPGIWLGFVMLGLYGLVGAFAEPLIVGQTFNALLQYFSVGSSYGTAIVGGVLGSFIAGIILFQNLRFSGRGVFVLFLLEVGFLVVFVLFIVVKQAVNGHLSAAPILPSGVTHGSAGFKAALLFTVFAMAGVDVPATVAEETKAPAKVVPRVTVIVLVVATLFFLFTSFGLANAVPSGELLRDIHSSAQAGPVYLIAGRYSSVFQPLVIVTAFSSIMAVFVAATVYAARITYALAREGLMPAWFSQLHPAHGTPRNAQMFWVGLAVVLPIPLSLWQSHSFAQGFAWIGAVFSGLVLVLYGFVNATNIIIHVRRRRSWGFHWLVNGLIPTSGIAVSLWLLWEAFLRPYGMRPFKAGSSVIWAFAVWLVAAQMFAVISWSRRSRRRFEA